MSAKALIFRRIFVILCGVLLFAAPSRAFVRIHGYFIAGETCPAYQSIKKKTNPGNLTLVKGMAYEVTGKNKPDATHYQIRVEGANPVSRWVPTTCGKLLTDCKTKSDPGSNGNGAGGKEPEYLLAISWQPAFCQTHQSKNECVTQTKERYDADHFALHGLWPQPKGRYYCGVNNRLRKLDKMKAWDQLPKLDISEETFDMLIEVMPGVASHLQRHEWYKHGTCYGEPAETYFKDSITLINQINDSAVRDLFAGNIGNTLSASEIRVKFTEAFGDGAGSKVKIRCDSGMISELWINLKGEIGPGAQIRDLLKEAEPADSGCGGGKIDEAGF